MTSCDSKIKITDLDAEESPDMMKTDKVEEINAGSSGEGRQKQNRLEKKCRRSIARLGLKPVTGIIKITVKKSKHLLFSITNPDVYKSPNSETYIIFGDALLDEVAAAAQNKPATSAYQPSSKSINTNQLTETQDMTTVDSTGISEKDIELVMNQGNLTRCKAIQALKENNNDVVEAIMSVS